MPPAAEAKLEAHPRPAKFIYDSVQIGDVVLWYQEGDAHSEPYPALVTSLGQALGLHVILRDSKTFRVVDGVAHITDPSCRRAETRESGGWDYTPRHKYMTLVLAKIGA